MSQEEAAAKDGGGRRRQRNLRSPDVMEEIRQLVERHYRSELVEKAKEQGGILRAGRTTIRLARQFGFCYGVERAIDLAYAARKLFSDRRVYLLGEIIHNPEVNGQLKELGIEMLPTLLRNEDFARIRKEDVVILPAFGAEVKVNERLQQIGCQIVDTTCGDVMSVWKRVRQNSKEGVTTILHGKVGHEETRATASRAVGGGTGHYVVVYDLKEATLVANYIAYGGDANVFLQMFEGKTSKGFHPDRDLKKIGVANQTTMLKRETEEIQNLLRWAIQYRDGGSLANYRAFDTICGATQERQDALFELLKEPPDLMVVVGGYNSSNTTHLVEIAKEKVPTYFIRDSSRILSAERICHFDIGLKVEVEAEKWLPCGEVEIGITAGASCPNNLIEEVILRIFEVRGEGLSF
ncbi:MAG: 4-hydroxy-3-methylbut-2-enyl diphosphate reductase [Chthoniobacterales bacterium]|nr:4-hydroxy-3-methylbut-2-enyl diphosphate reductase [Chthoniobacterales bacterium]